MRVREPGIVRSIPAEAHLWTEIENTAGKGRNSEEEMWKASPAVLHCKMPNLLASAWYRLGRCVGAFP
jgi:hypothetical protein